jgi:hypothetical protein
MKWRATITGNEDERAKGMKEMALAWEKRRGSKDGLSRKPSHFGLRAKKESDRKKNLLQKRGLSRKPSFLGLRIPNMLPRGTRQSDPPQTASRTQENISNWTFVAKPKQVSSTNPPRPSRRSTDPHKHNTKGTSTRKDAPRKDSSRKDPFRKNSSRKDSPLPSPTTATHKARHSSNRTRI